LAFILAVVGAKRTHSQQEYDDGGGYVTRSSKRRARAPAVRPGGRPTRASTTTGGEGEKENT